MPSASVVQFDRSCGSRLLLDQIADKWSVLVLAVLCEKPLRFNEIRRRVDGVTQKALTQTLRRLERNGILERRVFPTSPVQVEYEITALGRTLREPFEVLQAWAVSYQDAVASARERFDRRSAEAA